MYLGDGCICVTPRVCYLRVSLDALYPSVVAECADAMRVVMPGIAVRIHPRPGARMVNVDSHTRRWPDAFPQHGRGRKHERPIVLADWQQEIVDRFPEQFLRGLIHSDGCRTMNRFKTKLPSGRVGEYEYARYFFSNLSADIRALFCGSCDQLGIRWTQSNPRNISVSHRRASRGSTSSWARRAKRPCERAPPSCGAAAAAASAAGRAWSAARAPRRPGRAR